MSLGKISSDLVFHHTGVIVQTMIGARKEYSRLFGEQSLSPVYAISSQGVNVCFVKVGGEAYLELVESSSDDSKIARMARKMTTYYHVAYKTSRIETAVTEMEAEGFRITGDFFSSEAFEGKRCIFLFSSQAHLVELIET